jgi:hypothetical protein
MSPKGRLDYPDARTFLLPSRAYLTSFRDQTLPTRRVAIDDARAYFDEFNGDEGHRSQLALLGLAGEALQVVEDVGVLGHSLTSGAIPGLSFYVAATAYNPNNVNDFYSQAHKRDDDYYLKLAALRFAGTSITEHFTFEPPLDDATHVAIAAAESGTAAMLRNHIVWLARAWENFRQFFHAFKHGALLAHPEDVRVVGSDEEVLARMGVWRRRRSMAELGSEVSVPLTELAAHVVQVAEVALDTADYIAHTRLRIFERIRLGEDGAIEETGQGGSPWHFWFRDEDVAPEHVRQLEHRLGMTFVTTGSPA